MAQKPLLWVKVGAHAVRKRNANGQSLVGSSGAGCAGAGVVWHLCVGFFWGVAVLSSLTPAGSGNTRGVFPAKAPGSMARFNFLCQSQKSQSHLNSSLFIMRLAKSTKH
jgi:hypothetical protein